MLPAQIEEIKIATEKLEKEIFKPTEEKPGETPPVTGDQPPAEKLVEPPPESKDGVTPPSEIPPPLGEAPPEIPPPETPPPDNFEHKYKVLQGKYNKEIKEALSKGKSANDQLIELRNGQGQLLQQISDLTSRLEQLGKSATPSGVSTPQATGDLSQDLSEIEKTPEGQYLKNDFPQLWAAMSKVILRTVDTRIGDTRSRIEKVEKDVKASGESLEKTSKNSFYQYLDANVEGWAGINTSPEFKEWLDGRETYSGLSKLEIIKSKIANLDGPGTAEFFSDFKKLKEEPLEDSVETPAPPAPKAGQPKPSSSVAPPKGKAATPPKKPVTEDTITPEHINDFYQKVQRGYYTGRDAERSVEEKRIEKAVAEGRVVSLV